MPAEDLAKWDISMINQTLLKPASYAAMERETVLKNGLGTRYGLGVSVRSELGNAPLSMAAKFPGSPRTILFFPTRKLPWSF